jgi:hypothetical protein
MEKIASWGSIFILHVGFRRTVRGSGTGVTSHRDALRKCQKPLLLVCKDKYYIFYRFLPNFRPQLVPMECFWASSSRLYGDIDDTFSHKYTWVFPNLSIHFNSIIPSLWCAPGPFGYNVIFSAAFPYDDATSGSFIGWNAG